MQQEPDSPPEERAFGMHFLEKLLSEKLIAALAHVNDSPFGGQDPVMRKESAKIKYED
jgi:hypothetical protein